LTAQPLQGDFRYDAPARVPGGLQQPPAAGTGHVWEWTLLDLQPAQNSLLIFEQIEQPHAA
jgi:hypothetical protein